MSVKKYCIAVFNKTTFSEQKPYIYIYEREEEMHMVDYLLRQFQNDASHDQATWIGALLRRLNLPCFLASLSMSPNLFSQGERGWGSIVLQSNTNIIKPIYTDPTLSLFGTCLLYSSIDWQFAIKRQILLCNSHSFTVKEALA